MLQCALLNAILLYTTQELRSVALHRSLISHPHRVLSQLQYEYINARSIDPSRVSTCERLGTERSTGYLLYMYTTAHRVSCHVMSSDSSVRVRDNLIDHIAVVRVRSSSSFIVVRRVVAPSVFSVGHFNASVSEV